MKIILPILMVFVAGCYGFPRHFNFNAYADFVPCRDANAIQTLWPDFNNNRVFRQCITVGVYGVHNCPANLLFSFWDQVCVWERDWRAPPAPDQITPFPTTQWPRQSTATQEVTVSTDQPLTTPDVTTPPAGDSTTTHAEGDLTTTSLGDLTTLQEITLPENPDLTPPEVEATTNLTPPTANPTLPGQPPAPEDPILTPPTVEPTTLHPDLTPPMATTTVDPNFDPDAPIFTPAA